MLQRIVSKLHVIVIVHFQAHSIFFINIYCYALYVFGCILILFPIPQSIVVLIQLRICFVF